MKVAEELPYFAVRTTESGLAAKEVPKTAEALVAPAGTTMVAGIFASALLELMVTVNPPAGAGEPSLTVAVAERPPISEAGLTVSEVTTGARTVNVEVRVTPPAVAVMVTGVFAATAFVVNEKEPEV